MEHFYKSIPGWFGNEDLFRLAVENATDMAHFVEVGSYKGRSSSFMAVEIINSGKDIKLDCVDHWLGSDEPGHIEDQDVLNGTLFEAFTRNMLPVAGRYKAIRNWSGVASRSYPDLSLDFVFLDASHDYLAVKRDIEAWWPKVRAGGWLAGDDYHWGSVRAAVHDILHTKGIVTNKYGWCVIKNDNQPLQSNY